MNNTRDAFSAKSKRVIISSVSLIMWQYVAVKPTNKHLSTDCLSGFICVNLSNSIINYTVSLVNRRRYRSIGRRKASPGNIEENDATLLCLSCFIHLWRFSNCSGGHNQWYVLCLIWVIVTHFVHIVCVICLIILTLKYQKMFRIYLEILRTYSF